MTTQVLHGGTPDTPSAIPSRRDPGRGGRSRPRAGAAPAKPAPKTGAIAHARPRAASAPRRTPNRWAGIGVGLTVAVATTTTLTATAPQAAAPDVDDRPTTGALRAITQAATALEARDGAASRSTARTAPAARTADTSAPVTVSDETTLTVEALTPGGISPAPEPVLPGCDGEAAGLGTNGQVPDSELCTLWDGHTKIRADAAVALAKLNEAYVAAWGESMCITDGYRTYAQQVSVKAAKPSLAATPGRSNHGWGLAVDICADSYAGARWNWLAAHAPQYGWDNPDWARAGGAGAYEPWHWEFTAAVAQVGGS